MQPRDLSDHVAYRPGRGVEETARELGRDPATFLTLASNENPLGPSPAATTAIRETATTVNTYPKAAHTDLTAVIADRWEVDPAQIWLANGGDGAIDYLSRALLRPGETVLVPTPGFAYYGMSARFHHGQVREYPLTRSNGFHQVPSRVLEVADGVRMVYLTSPHNPTGSTCSLSAIREIAAETGPETLVVVDEAYGEFAETESAIAVLSGRDGGEPRDDVAVVRTFSKAYGLAGVRLGYAVVPDAWAAAYERVSTPFAVSEIACRAGLAALEDDEHVTCSVEVARESRAYMREHVDARTWPSEGNFVLVDVGDGRAVAAAMCEAGVIVRDCTSFGLPFCIRITCAPPAETERAVEALNEVLATRADDGHDTGEEVSGS